VKPSSARSLAAASIEPMALRTGSTIPEGPGWTFEPKYDGIRVLAFVEGATVRLVTRNERDKAKQFPEVVEALHALAARARRRFVLDGEIVALHHGEPTRFQALQPRVNLEDTDAIVQETKKAQAALIAFDLLLDGDDYLIDQPWPVRRERLERLLRHHSAAHLRLGASVPGDARAMLEKARADGWEGIIAKRIDAPYEPGKRSSAWLKLKTLYQQEFVVGGWTEPRNTREYIGALLLGYFDGGRLSFAGRVGTGFDRAALRSMYERLRPLERKTSPFAEPPKTDEPVHWTRPEVVVEVKFSEWTNDGKLRQPVFLGVRDDKGAHDVVREPVSIQGKA
jgi:bifunctional non-homologous end joining protein LigD